MDKSLTLMEPLSASPAHVATSPATTRLSASFVLLESTHRVVLLANNALTLVSLSPLVLVSAFFAVLAMVPSLTSTASPATARSALLVSTLPMAPARIVLRAPFPEMMVPLSASHATAVTSPTLETPSAASVLQEVTQGPVRLANSAQIRAFLSLMELASASLVVQVLSLLSTLTLVFPTTAPFALLEPTLLTRLAKFAPQERSLSLTVPESALLAVAVANLSWKPSPISPILVNHVTLVPTLSTAPHAKDVLLASSLLTLVPVSALLVLLALVLSPTP